MFIRRTRTRADRGYLTFRPVRSERIGNKVRQRTLPDPGRHPDVAQGRREGELRHALKVPDAPARPKQACGYSCNNRVK